MTTINSVSNTPVSPYEAEQNVTEISEVINSLDREYSNEWAMRFLYNEWMQKVLLSDGIDADENYDW
ncbi:MAG: hypothetical protein ACMZI0_03600 [Symbiopectobacterium sp.]|uniref:hypothetical protein n=1 Tax=Symbiopectobacterium sp. TaxID=2952789 RepID=UPI0039E98820